MIGNEIYDYFHSGIVGTCYKGLKLRHPVGYVGGEVGVYVIIILYGVWRPCYAFYYIMIITGNAILRVVCGSSMLYDTGVPHMSNAERTYRVKYTAADII